MGFSYKYQPVAVYARTDLFIKLLPYHLLPAEQPQVCSRAGSKEDKDEKYGKDFILQNRQIY